MSDAVDEEFGAAYDSRVLLGNSRLDCLRLTAIRGYACLATCSQPDLQNNKHTNWNGTDLLDISSRYRDGDLDSKSLPRACLEPLHSHRNMAPKGACPCDFACRKRRLQIVHSPKQMPFTINSTPVAGKCVEFQVSEDSCSSNKTRDIRSGFRKDLPEICSMCTFRIL